MFFAFRVMVGLGVLMLLLVVCSAWAWWRGKLGSAHLLHTAWRWMAPAGFVALLSGWYVTEIGRQPWVVYGVLRTRDAVSPLITRTEVLWSLASFISVYVVIFGAGIWYLIRLLQKGPEVHESAPDSEHGLKTAARPLSTADARDIGEGSAP